MVEPLNLASKLSELAKLSSNVQSKADKDAQERAVASQPPAPQVVVVTEKTPTP